MRWLPSTYVMLLSTGISLREEFLWYTQYPSNAQMALSAKPMSVGTRPSPRLSVRVVQGDVCVVTAALEISNAAATIAPASSPDITEPSRRAVPSPGARRSHLRATSC